MRVESRGKGHSDVVVVGKIVLNNPILNNFFSRDTRQMLFPRNQKLYKKFGINLTSTAVCPTLRGRKLQLISRWSLQKNTTLYTITHQLHFWVLQPSSEPPFLVGS